MHANKFTSFCQALKKDEQVYIANNEALYLLLQTSLSRSSSIGPQQDAGRLLLRCPRRRQQILIDICCPRPGCSKSTARRRCLQAIDRRDRQTDGRNDT